MWKFGKKRKKEDAAAASAPAQEVPAVAAAGAGVVAENDVVFSHPGGFGAMMFPPSALEAGFFAGKPRKKKRDKANANDSSGCGCNGNSNGDAATTSADAHIKQQQHPLCSKNPAQIDDLLSKAQLAKEAEDALRAEAAKLRATKTQLDKDIQRLQRDKTDRTEAHLAELDQLRRNLETDAEKGKSRLKYELKKEHAKSMDELRRTLEKELDVVTGETKLVDVMNARQAGASAAATPAAAAAAKGGGGGSKVNGAEAAAAAAAAGDTPMLPMSAGFWKSFANAFTPRDFVDMSNGGGGDGGGSGSVPPPALLVLAAVPLFCFYKRWRVQR